MLRIVGKQVVEKSKEAVNAIEVIHNLSRSAGCKAAVDAIPGLWDALVSFQHSKLDTVEAALGTSKVQRGAKRCKEVQRGAKRCNESSF